MNDKKNKKKLYLVSGFLGAGKTTFMHNFIDYFENQKLAIIVNEFGKQGMDGLLLKRDSISLKEISNGSIFCNCRSDSFIDALVKISEYPVDTVLVECSGLSDPTGMGKIMSVVQKLTENSYDYKGTIAIADATNIEKLVTTAPAVKLQIASSDLVIVNKIDLVDVYKIKSVENTILQVNPLVKIARTSFGKISNQKWIEDLSNKNSSGDINITKTKIIGTQKLLVSMKENYDKRSLERWIEDFSDTFYRIKGFVLIDNKWSYVDGTSNQLEIYPTDIVPEDANLVILASGNQPVKKKMLSSWEKYFNHELILL
ncbi:GTP-binding protein [Wukongibacter baidiensis]|uniref:CobW family GTP-binding protein n=1 Tax=Wukongibacter baidiensis TaxID=1723361 RepID=UPI003D7F2B6B